MSSSTELDKLGEQAANGLKLLGSKTEALRPIIQQIRDAFADAKKNKVAITVNGQSSWTAWAAWTGKDVRTFQYILRGGNKNRAQKDEAKHVSRVVTARLQYADYHTAQLKFTNPDGTVTGEMLVYAADGIDDLKQSTRDVYKKMVAALKAMRLWDDQIKVGFDEQIKDQIDHDEHTAKKKGAEQRREKKPELAATYAKPEAQPTAIVPSKNKKKSDGSGSKKEHRALLKIQKEAQANVDAFRKGEMSANDFRVVTDDLIKDEAQGAYGLSTPATKRKVEDINQRVTVEIRYHERVYGLSEPAKALAAVVGSDDAETTCKDYTEGEVKTLFEGGR